MKIQVGISNRHVHLTESTYKKLFFDEPLKKMHDLKQKGQFTSLQTVTIKTEKSQFNNVRIVGPFREYDQVEISKTDSYILGIEPPIRRSGDLYGSSPITIIGPKGSVNLSYGCIIAKRHIHISEKLLEELKWNKSDLKTVIINNDNGGMLFDVELNVSNDAFFEIHLDTDEANAFNLKNNDVIEIRN